MGLFGRPPVYMSPSRHLYTRKRRGTRMDSHVTHTPATGHVNQAHSVMWMRWWLLLLYLLQLMVLSGLVAAYIYNISAYDSPAPPSALISQPPTSATAPPETATTTTSQGASPTKAESKKEGVKLLDDQVKLRPIHLSHLRQRVPALSSRLDLVRLFTDSNINDLQLSRWMTRTLRSTSISTGHGLNLKPLHNAKFGMFELETKDYSVGKADSSSKVKNPDKEFPPDIGISGDGGVVDIKREAEIIINHDDMVMNVEETIHNDDYYFDYPQDDPGGEDYEAFEAALHHMDEMSTCAASRCKDPQPFVEYVRDPMNIYRVFIPECAVLHRCMNFSGCCSGSNQECVPKKMNIINKAFLVVDRISGDEDYVMFNPSLAAVISFVNHTECECRERAKLPKCTKSCPAPFRLSREGDQCICGCFPSAQEDDAECEWVKQGVKQLSHDGLVCIKNEVCYNPQCTVGEFDVKTGLCPLSDEYSLPTFLFDNPDDRRHYREHLRSYEFSSKNGEKTVSQTTAKPEDFQKSPKKVANLGSIASTPKTETDTMAKEVLSLQELDTITQKTEFSTVRPTTMQLKQTKPTHKFHKSSDMSSKTLSGTGDQKSEVDKLDTSSTKDVSQTSSKEDVLQSDDLSKLSKNSDTRKDNVKDNAGAFEQKTPHNGENKMSAHAMSSTKIVSETSTIKTVQRTPNLMGENKLNAKGTTEKPKNSEEKGGGTRSESTPKRSGNSQTDDKSKDKPTKHLPSRNLFNFHSSSHFHESFRPSRPRKSYNHNTKTTHNTPTTSTTTRTPKKVEKSHKTNPPTTQPILLPSLSTASSSVTSPTTLTQEKPTSLPLSLPEASSSSEYSYINLADSEALQDKRLNDQEDFSDLDEEAVLEELYNYEYSSLEGSGEEFDYKFT